MSLWISTVLCLKQSPGAEEFACLSLVWEPHGPSQFRTHIGHEWVATIRDQLTGRPGRVTLVGLLDHPVDSHPSTFRKVARQALEDLAPGPPLACRSWSADFPEEGSWMLRVPEEGQEGTPDGLVRSRVWLYRPGMQVRVQGQMGEEGWNWTLLQGPDSSLERCCRLALWQARRITFSDLSSSDHKLGV